MTLRSPVGLGRPYQIVDAADRTRTLQEENDLRRRAKEHADKAISGMKKAAEEHRVRPLAEQMEERKQDHPGYRPPST